jgi:hypothetical protein
VSSVDYLPCNFEELQNQFRCIRGHRWRRRIRGRKQTSRFHQCDRLAVSRAD